MALVPFSPDTTKNQYSQVDLDYSKIRTQAENLRRLANEQVLTRNANFARSVVFATSDLAKIMGDQNCNRIRLTHVAVKKKSGNKYYSSLLAVGQDLLGNEMIDHIFVGTPDTMITQNTTIEIHKDKVKFTEGVTDMAWVNNLPAPGDALYLHEWLQTAFHDQIPVFLPLLARFDKTNDWPKISSNPWIAFAPAIFKCNVTGATLSSPSGEYCTFIIIGLDNNFKPVDGTFYLISDMWRPNYPITESYKDETSGFIPTPKYQPGMEGDLNEVRDAD